MNKFEINDYIVAKGKSWIVCRVLDDNGQSCFALDQDGDCEDFNLNQVDCHEHDVSSKKKD